MSNPTGTNIECKNCGKIFYAPGWDIKRGRKFCAQSCKAIWMSTLVGEQSVGWKGGKVTATCQMCTKEFETYPSTLSEGKGKFCSKTCHIEHQKTLTADKSHNWKGGHMNVHGYRMRGKVKEHRYVMEQYLGRKLESWEHIHHKNGTKTDNHIENLELVTAQTHNTHHIRYHVIDGKKECSTCHKMLPLDQYSKDTANWNGYRYACKDCHNTYRRSAVD